MKFKDYYETLGVDRNASADEVKRAYRKLARKFHPDVSEVPNAEERFKEVQEAYEVIRDPEKRAAYDQFGANWKTGQDFTPPPDWDSNAGFTGFTEAGDFSEFFESLFGRHGHSAGFRGHSPRKGEDVHARLEIGLEEAFHGATRSITLSAPSRDELGGVTLANRTLKVKIPEGVSDGQRIRLARQGAPGMGEAPPGDLYIEVVLAPHKYFRTKGRNVYLDVPVTPWEAALGRSVTVPTLGGKVDVKVPAGAASGTRLRLKGRGLPGHPPGDQYVVLTIIIPEIEGEKTRALYEQMERDYHDDPRAELAT